MVELVRRRLRGAFLTIGVRVGMLTRGYCLGRTIGQVLWKWEVLRCETIRGMHRDAVVKLRRGRRRGHGMLKVLPMGLTGWLWLMKMGLWMLEW